jgi:protein-disulfide isomerase
MNTSRSYVIALVALTLVAPGCAQKSDVEAVAKAVETSNKEILAKLEKLEKDIAAKPAAPAAQRPQVDPNKVYEIPVASSAVRGPKDAPVTITMFSDFQAPGTGGFSCRLWAP